ncbi:MAG: hypothetical protein ACRYFX_03710 [Janthinobacterium lividum]
MLNRRFLLAFIMVLAGVVATYAQASDVAVAAIRVEYQRIWSSRSTYKTRSVDLPDELTEGGEGGEGIAYYENKSLKLLAVARYWETGKLETQYYYKNGQLFFALNLLYSYNRPFYYDKKAARESGDTEAFDLKKAVIKEDRYYLQNGKLIRWLDHTKKEQPLAAASQQQDYRELLAREVSVRAGLRK